MENQGDSVCETKPTLLASDVDGRRKRKTRRKLPSETDHPQSPNVSFLDGIRVFHFQYAQEATLFGAYAKREQLYVEREASEEMQFVYLFNDNTLQALKLLTDVKNVYSRQLPNMPKEYICKLVFNKTHRSIAVLKRGKGVIGSITYKTFADQNFAEIAFCAVEGLEQVKHEMMSSERRVFRFKESELE